jgi:hypothetical protein
MCIVRAGNRQCPAGPYSDRQLVHTGFTDNRDCAPCTCSGSPTCEGTIELRSGTGGCPGPGSQIGTLTVDDGQNCTSTTLSPTCAFFDTTRYGGECTAAGDQAAKPHIVEQEPLMA